MALQTSGPISLLDVQNEFGGGNPIEITEYYRGRRVPDIPENNSVPTSGTISLSNFYGTVQSVGTVNVAIVGGGGGGGPGAAENSQNAARRDGFDGAGSSFNISFRGNRAGTGGERGAFKGSNFYDGEDGGDSIFGAVGGDGGDAFRRRQNLQNRGGDGRLGGGGGGGAGDIDSGKRDNQGNGGEGGDAGGSATFSGQIGQGSWMNWNIGHGGDRGYGPNSFSQNSVFTSGAGGGGAITFNYRSRNYLFQNFSVFTSSRGSHQFQ